MLTSDHQTVVPARFSGFPGIVQGGYICGLVASGVGAPAAEVRLRRPVRARVPLTLERASGERVELCDGEVLVAEGNATELELELPEPIGFAEAQAASGRYPGLEHHLVPGCFVCGTAHPEGLRIFAGPVPGRRVVAATWVPGVTWANRAGRVRDEIVWAALDCPQLWSLIINSPPKASEKIVTGAMVVKLERPVVAGEPHVVMAWPRAREGRRLVADAAVLGPDGEVCARGRQIAVSANWGLPLGLALWAPESNHSETAHI